MDGTTEIGVTFSASGTVDSAKVAELRDKTAALLEEFKAAGATGAYSFSPASEESAPAKTESE